MKKILKWFGIALAGVVGILIIAVVIVLVISNSRINRVYDFQAEPVVIPTDNATIDRGQYLAVTRGCVDCHGEDFSGGVLLDDPTIGVLYAPNLTSGRGGKADFSDIDWVRAIRHGVDPQGKPLFAMPSQDYYFMSDEDLGAIVAYLKQAPSVDNQTPEKSLGIMGRVFFVIGQFGPLPAEVIDHVAQRPSAPQAGITNEYGAYLIVNCVGCHGKDLAGGPIPGSEPGSPLAANLTTAGAIADWTEEDFLTAMHTGIRPDGSQIDRAMPWWSLGQMTDEELQALWLYLQSVPPVESSTQK